MLSHQPESSTLQPLCYEHHTVMRLDQMVSRNGTEPFQPRYVCQACDCLARYTSTEGYFLAERDGGRAEEEILPRVRCPRDGAPMYLGEVRPHDTAFRLWRCPQCDSVRTNEENLANHIPENVKPSVAFPTSQRAR